VNPNLRGVITESTIAAEAVRLGLAVLVPAFGAPRCDMVLERDGRMLRVQCKSAAVRGDVITVRAITCRRTAHGYERGTYSRDEVDLIAAYCHELKRCFAIPIEDFGESGHLSLRLSPPRNGQRAGLHFADKYDFGAIAQLEEHLHGMQGVGGSSPPSSTPRADSQSELVVGSHEFRNRFGWYMERAAAGEGILVTHRGRPRIRIGPVQEPLMAAA
jgi:prevent-host-death family protein